MPEDKIVEKFDGDAQIVKIWIDFLKDNRWLIKDTVNNKWILTDKGKEQMISYYHV